MSDFDDVLERLITDPTFQARLAADPRSALAGYTLDDAERELLGAQLVAGDGGGHGVETRTNKSGVVGLIGPALSAFGLAGGHEAVQTFGQAPNQSGPGGQGAVDAFGSAPQGGGHQGGLPQQGPVQTFGSAPQQGPTQTFGSAPQQGPTQTFGSAPTGSASGGDAAVPAAGYHTHVDADGDGHWDAYQAYERPDGGVDIEVDTNHDGKVDFIGHDYNRDGLVDAAE